MSRGTRGPAGRAGRGPSGPAGRAPKKGGGPFGCPLSMAVPVIALSLALLAACGPRPHPAAPGLHESPRPLQTGRQSP